MYFWQCLHLELQAPAHHHELIEVDAAALVLSDDVHDGNDDQDDDNAVDGDVDSWSNTWKRDSASRSFFNSNELNLIVVSTSRLSLEMITFI